MLVMRVERLQSRQTYNYSIHIHIPARIIVSFHPNYSDRHYIKFITISKFI